MTELSSGGDSLFASYSEAAKAQAESGITSADPLKLAIEQARAQQDLYFQTLNQDLPQVAKISDLKVPSPHGEVAIRLVYPDLVQAKSYIVFVRGGGFWAGNLDSHARTMRSLALLSGSVVCAIDYRRTPEFHFPVQRNEIVSVLDYLQTHQESLGILGCPVLFGESAGATLALSAAQYLRDQNQDQLAGLVLFYNNAGGFKPNARAYSQWVWKQYLGPHLATDDPQAVPLLGDLGRLPPVWIGVGEDDPLMTDSQKLAELLKVHGQDPILRVYQALPHGFLMWTGSLQPAFNALQESVEAIKVMHESKNT